MKVLLDIKDDKPDLYMLMLKEIDFIKKVNPLSKSKALFLMELKEAVEEVNQAKKGKIKLQSAKDFLNEL